MTSPEPVEDAASVAVGTRWTRFGIALLLVGIGLRALLPIALASQLADRASVALGESVAIGNVDLAVWRGGITIEDVALGPGPRSRLASVATELDWIALAGGALRLRHLSIDGLDLALSETEDGLVAFPSLPPAEPAPTSQDADDEPFAIEIDELRLSQARVQASDVDSGALGFELRVAALAVDTLAWRDGSLALGAFALDGPELRLGGVLEPDAAPALGEDPTGEAAIVEAEAAEPFDLEIGSIAIDTARISLEREDVEPIELTLRLSADDVRLGAEAFLVTLAVRGDAGTLELEGQLAARPPRFDGKLAWGDIDLVALAQFSPGFAPQLESARSSGSLDVTWAPAATVVAGEVKLADVALQASRDLRLEWTALDFEAERIEVPGVGADPAPIVVELERLAWRAPQIEWTDRGRSASAGEGEAGAETTPVIATLGTLDVDDGSLTVHDRTTDPAWKTRIEDLSLRARELEWPERSARDVLVSGQGQRGTLIAVAGNLHRGSGRLHGSVRELDLPPYNGLIVEAAGIAVDEGAADVESVVDVVPDGFVSQSTVTLRDLDVREVEAGAFQALFGVPADAAFAVLRQPDGTIVLPLPVEAQGDDLDVALRNIIASAMQSAVIGALAAPLKIFQAMAPGSTNEDRLHVTTLPGRDELRGRKSLESVVSRLRSEPGTSVRLHGRTEPVDDPQLAADAIHEAIRAGEPPPGDSSEDIETTNRLVAALRDLGLDERGRLDTDLYARLASWASRVSVKSERRAALAASRAKSARRALEAAGIESDRVLEGEHRPGATGVGFEMVSGDPEGRTVPADVPPDSVASGEGTE